MKNEARPDPDILLASLEEEERGKLTVFLGAAAGVGKTFAMLEAAQERLAEGVDVVVGWVETHGRVETEALLKGLPVNPPPVPGLPGAGICRDGPGSAPVQAPRFGSG